MARKQNLPIPEKLANAPRLTPGLEFYYSAFLNLSSERQVGFSEGRIPWSKVKDYCDRLKMSLDDFERTWAIIAHMDAAYLKYRGEKSKTGAGAGGKTPIGGGPAKAPISPPRRPR